MMTLLERLQHFIEHLRKRSADSWGVYEINEWALLRFLGEDNRFYPGSVAFHYRAANLEYVRGVLQPYSGVELSRWLTNKLLALLPPATEGDSHAPK